MTQLNKITLEFLLLANITKITFFKQFDKKNFWVGERRIWK